MANSTHTYAPDDRNESILININGALIPREQATISVFDSGFILGDGIWEGLRVHNGAIPFLGRHLKRLWEGAKALDLDMGLSQQELTDRLFQTLEFNQMTDHVYSALERVVLSRHPTRISSDYWGPTIVIIPEYKAPDPLLMIAVCGYIPFIPGAVMPMCRTLRLTATQN